MIICKLIIKEMPDGRVAVAMDPEQTGATEAELRTAHVIDTAMQAAGEVLLKGKEVMAAGVGIKEHIKRFVEQAEGQEEGT